MVPFKREISILIILIFKKLTCCPTNAIGGGAFTGRSFIYHRLKTSLQLYSMFIGCRWGDTSRLVILNLYPVGDMICSIVFTVRSLHRVAKVGAERIFRVKRCERRSEADEIYEMYLLAELKRRKLAYSRSRKSGDAK